MKQIFQDLSSGETSIVEIPLAAPKAGYLLIRSRNSLVSTGTERMLIDFGKANWIDKARQQPDKVRMVLEKIRTDGLMPTVEAVRNKLDQPLPLGYCNAGEIMESRVEGFEVGDRVVSNGPHSEVVRVPGNLCAKIPDDVDDETASFTVLASIALQGVRLVNPTIGESVVVIGLGLIGLITVQILRANGCHVIGADFDVSRCELAQRSGADAVPLGDDVDLVSEVNALTQGRGADAVMITAATKSNEPVRNAAQMSRKRGRVILVGVVGLELSRADFYEKELTFQVSCSYGPGRYDPEYEEQGHDYPLGFVRWTEQRNFEAVLRMMSEGAIDIKPLITHRYAFDEALKAYEHLDDGNALGIVLEYAKNKVSVAREVSLRSGPASERAGEDEVVCGFLGAGNYASRILLPAFKSAGAVMDTIVSSGGANAVRLGRKHGFRSAGTEEQAIFGSDAVNTVVIATRHDLHAEQVCQALNAGQNVFVEKPLAINMGELDRIESTCAGGPAELMVGFNRRFAPQIMKMKQLLGARRAAKILVMTVNAGQIPADHWTQSLSVGGGRIVGEGCHFIDLLRFLVGAPITGHSSVQIGSESSAELRDDKVTICLKFEDGSFGTIHYFANGHKSFPKERLEVFCDGGVLQLDNFKSMRGYGWSGFRKMNLLSQNKGNAECVSAFVKALRSGAPSPIPPDELFEVSRVTLQVAAQLMR